MGLLREEKVIEYTKEGIARTRVVVHEPPFFYRGPTPLEYESGVLHLGSSRLVIWNQFKDFQVKYSSENSHGVGMTTASAVALDHKGNMLAKAEIIEIIKGQGVHVQEEHLDPTGKVTYSAKSFFGFDGEKSSESETKNKKKNTLGHSDDYRAPRLKPPFGCRWHGKK